MKYKDTVILVFAKAPVAGNVNTRLIPAIGAAAATQLHKTLLYKRLETITQAELCDVTLMCAPDTSHVCFGECESRYSVSLLAQKGEDLGQRISNGIEQALYSKKHSKKNIIVVGTDAPALSAAEIEKAIVALALNDLVIVPAEDGGYVLIGMSTYLPELFEGIEWGSDRVMQQTRDKIIPTGFQLKELMTCWDIDREEDYLRYLDWLE